MHASWLGRRGIYFLIRFVATAFTTLPTKVAGTHRRAVRSQTFARAPGGRHMECAYYFDFCRLCRLRLFVDVRGGVIAVWLAPDTSKSTLDERAK